MKGLEMRRSVAMDREQRAVGGIRPGPRRVDTTEARLRAALPGADPAELTVMRALAVLGGVGTARLAADLIDRDIAETRGVVAELAAAGLVQGERWAHREYAERLLGELPGEELRDLHARTAELLYKNGFPAVYVARHLVAAGDVRGTWAARVLVAAADEALREYELDRAGQCLELAYRASRRARERAAIAARLVSVEWCTNPSSRTRNFGRLKAALRTGRVPHPELPATVLHMLWHGYALHADHALTRLDRAVDGVLPGGPRFEFLCAWLRYTHPVQMQRYQRLFEGPVRPGYPAERDTPHGPAGKLLAALLTQHPPAELPTAAQRILAGHRLTLDTVEVLVAAVDCLIHTDRLDTADAWCVSLLAESAARGAPTWQSIFAAARAETLLRKGNLAGAAEHAVLALNLLPADHLGVWVGRPLAVLVRALTALGKHAEAAAQLRRPVPRAMFDSRFALAYLSAHGDHCLATGRPEEALRHYRRCGNLMQEWQLDFAWLAPWRNDMAAASLAAGQHWQAQAFASMHLDLIGGADGHRTGGTSLRLLAATNDEHRRVPLLRRAVAIARAGADERELATALVDLGNSYRAMGDADRARPLLREASRLTAACGAAEPTERLAGALPEPALTQPIPVTGGGRDALSPAERRVAELAALGQRNREIAAALDITTSTVEQHLTKVYRKLSVARRGELRFALVEQAATAGNAVG